METVRTPSTGACSRTRLRGQKPPLKAKEIWAIRIRLQLSRRTRDLALFNLAIDSKLRGCDLVALKVHDIAPSGAVASRAIAMQRKTQRPVQFEITEQTRDALTAWIGAAGLRPDQSLFPSRIAASPHISTRQYARIVRRWVASIGLEPATYGTHTMRRTKATLIYRRIGTFARCNCCSGTPSLRARSGTSASRWTTRWRFQSRPTREPSRWCDRRHRATVADRPVAVIRRS